MELFSCLLVRNDGLHAESFFRSGESSIDVLDELKRSDHPNGFWIVSSLEEINNYKKLKNMGNKIEAKRVD